MHMAYTDKSWSETKQDLRETSKKWVVREWDVDAGISPARAANARQNPAASVHNNPQTVHILSTPTPTTVLCQRSEFKSLDTWSPVANARLAANVSYAVAVALTVVLLPVMCRDARLLCLLPVLLGLWHTTAGCQRWLFTAR
jgi:hypothetical protein